MRDILKIINDMSENIDEARDKIAIAYTMKSSCPMAASWYKEMAMAHIAFNNSGHDIVASIISSYKNSPEYNENIDYANGMIDAYKAIHEHLISRASDVQSKISLFK